MTLWTANPSFTVGFLSLDLTEFNGNVWFLGATATVAEGFQLYKLGFDGSVTKWTAINPAGGGLNPMRAVSSLPMMIRASEPPMKVRRSMGLRNPGSMSIILPNYQS